jgi:hypothetical protein
MIFAEATCKKFIGQALLKPRNKKNAIKNTVTSLHINDIL